MSEQFKVGDVCIGQNFALATHRNQLECVIVEGLEMRTATCSVTGETQTNWLYTVRWSDDQMAYVRPHRLRKKRPPSREIDTVVAWADCAWKPQGVTA